MQGVIFAASRYKGFMENKNVIRTFVAVNLKKGYLTSSEF